MVQVELMLLHKRQLQTESREIAELRKGFMRPAETGLATDTAPGTTHTGTETDLRRGRDTTSTGPHTLAGMTAVDTAGMAIKTGLGTGAEVNRATATAAGRGPTHLKYEEVRMSGR